VLRGRTATEASSVDKMAVLLPCSCILLQRYETEIAQSHAKYLLHMEGENAAMREMLAFHGLGGLRVGCFSPSSSPYCPWLRIATGLWHCYYPVNFVVLDFSVE